MAKSRQKNEVDVVEQQGEEVELQTSAPQATEQNNLEQVRDILFGAQSREYTERFSTLESDLQKRAKQLQENIEERFSRLETMMVKNVEDLVTRLTNEQQERNRSLDDLSSQLASTANELEHKLTQLDDQMHILDSDMGKALVEESKQLSEAMHEQYLRLSEALDKQVENLSHDKTDRLSLAKMFSEVARQLEESDKASDQA